MASPSPFVLELRDHLEPKQPGAHRVVCALESGAVTLPAYVSIKVGKKRCVARIDGLERAGQTLSRFEELSREVIATVVVLDATENDLLERVSRPLRKQRLTPAKSADALAAERSFERDRLVRATAQDEHRRRHVVAANATQQRLAALVGAPLSPADMASFLSVFEGGEAARALLHHAVKGEVSASVAGHSVVIAFQRGTASYLLHAEPPDLTGAPDERWPESFKRLLGHHARVSFFKGTQLGDNDGLGLTLSEEGLPGELEVPGESPEDTLCPLWVHSDCYVYLTSTGGRAEPHLALLSHAAGLLGAVPEPIGPLFVRLAREALENE